MKTLKKIIRPDKYFRDLINTTRKTNDKIELLLREVESLKMIIQKNTAELMSGIEQSNDLLLTQRNNAEEAKKLVTKMRNSERYKRYFEPSEPLISVRIATYNRSKLLVERAIPSILKQTYQNFEIVIVGDHCTDDTEKKIKELKDNRIKFYNLPGRTYYPEDKYKKWLVVGAAPANKAVELAKGDWIATLDDDDEYKANHLEALIKLAQKTKSELVYSALESTHELNGDKKIIWSDPPHPGSFSMMGALYLRELAAIFKTDEQGWAVRLPQDWYLCKRMLEAGVKYASTKTITGDIHLLTYEEKKDI